MNCYPRCDLALPEIGNAKVFTNFINICEDRLDAKPGITIRIIHEVKSTSTFILEKLGVEPRISHLTDTRKIGTEAWPLKLNVQFYEQPSKDVFVKACVLTERTNHMSCFMNSTFSRTELLSACDDTRGASASMPMFVLTILLAILFLSLAVGFIILAHRAFNRIHHYNKGSRNMHKQSQCAALLPQSQKFSMEEDRLTVIEEEKEEPSRISPSPSSSGVESMARFEEYKPVPNYFTPTRSIAPVSTVVSTPQPLFQTFRSHPPSAM